MRFALAVLLFLAPAALCAGEGAVNSGDAWTAFAGAADEAEAEGLVLRDELIAANLSYLAALEAALAEIDAMPESDPLRAPAWARAEYLLEASFGLLSDTAENDAFLRATQALKPDPVPVADAVELSDAGGDGPLDGGLRFVGEDGGALTPVDMDGVMRLTDADGGTLPPGADIVAAPGQEPDAPPSSYVPLIKARAAWLRAQTLERLGRTAEARAEVDGLGFIRDWLVLGPLDTETEVDSFLNFGLQEASELLVPGRSFAGKQGPIRWRPASSADPLGRLRFGSLFRSQGMNTALALALVHSPVDTGAILRFGANAPTTVCVNHIQGRRRSRGGATDSSQEAFSVWLRKGWNVVLVRSGSPRNEWAAAVRLTALDGSPFPGHVARPTAETAPLILELAAKTARRTVLDRFYQPSQPAELAGVSILSRWLEARPDDARANFYLASFLVSRDMMEGEERFDRELIFRHATEYSNGNPFFTLMAARSVDSGMEGPDREENLRLVLLRAVADQGSAAALVDIGRLYLDVMRQPRRADDYAEQALAVNPMSLRAGVLDYDVAVAMRWEPVAKELLQRLVQRHPSAAQARLRLGRSALAAGRPRQALTEFHAILGIDAGNAEALNGVVRALGMLGQTSAAVDLLVGHIERFPYDFPVRNKLAELYRALGRDDDARLVLTAALEMAPDDAEALAMRREIDRETYAEGKTLDAAAAGRRKLRQELDLSAPEQPPPNGWEYLYFQIEDRMAHNGAIDRTVSFALRIYSAGAARLVRHLGFWLERDFESGTVTMLNVIQPDGSREVYTSPTAASAAGQALKLYLPPLRSGMVVEAEVEIHRRRIPFLGEYFGQIAPLTQQAPLRLSRYMFTAPAEARLFFRPVNGAPEALVVDSEDGSEVTRIWEMRDLPAFVAEPDSPGQHELMPCVQVSSFENWDDFARWYWRLIGVQYHTPPELRLLAESVAGDETLPIVKLDKAAEWVARNIGHRDWEYGPYAFRPINARSILSRLSADGKDRTLFLCLLAREYGLDAWPVLSRLRDRRYAPAGDVSLSLPLLDHFNHSLVMVEGLPGGSVFLDASNPYRSPGVMPSQLFGSPGIAIIDGEAERVLIPDGGTAACTWEETAVMEVDEDGSVVWEQEIRGEGTAAETLRRRFRDPERRSQAWTSFLSSMGAAASASWEDFGEIPAQPASARFSGRARLKNMAAVDEERVVMPLPALPGALVTENDDLAYPLSLAGYANHGTRQQDLLLPHGFRISRRLDISYPDGWRVVNPPSSFRTEYPFGSLEVASTSNPGRLALEFTVEIPGHRIAATEYAAFREMAALAERWKRPLLVWEKP